jgi:hypothetical protein
VASRTGAGYSRETAVLLAILAGVVVGVADAVLVWIVSVRSEKEMRAARQMGMKMSKGSGAIVEPQLAIEGQEEEVDAFVDSTLGDLLVEETQETASSTLRSVRLRRRQLR